MCTFNLFLFQRPLDFIDFLELFVLLISEQMLRQAQAAYVSPRITLFP